MVDAKKPMAGLAQAPDICAARALARGSGSGLDGGFEGRRKGPLKGMGETWLHTGFRELAIGDWRRLSLS